MPDIRYKILRLDPGTEQYLGVVKNQAEKLINTFKGVNAFSRDLTFGSTKALLRMVEHSKDLFIARISLIGSGTAIFNRLLTTSGYSVSGLLFDSIEFFTAAEVAADPTISGEEVISVGAVANYARCKVSATPGIIVVDGALANNVFYKEFINWAMDNKHYKMLETVFNTVYAGARTYVSGGVAADFLHANPYGVLEPAHFYRDTDGSIVALARFTSFYYGLGGAAPLSLPPTPGVEAQYRCRDSIPSFVALSQYGPWIVAKVKLLDADGKVPVPYLNEFETNAAAPTMAVRVRGTDVLIPLPKIAALVAGKAVGTKFTLPSIVDSGVLVGVLSYSISYAEVKVLAGGKVLVKPRPTFNVYRSEVYTQTGYVSSIYQGAPGPDVEFVDMRAVVYPAEPRVVCSASASSIALIIGGTYLLTELSKSRIVSDMWGGIFASFTKVSTQYLGPGPGLFHDLVSIDAVNAVCMNGDGVRTLPTETIGSWSYTNYGSSSIDRASAFVYEPKSIAYDMRGLPYEFGSVALTQSTFYIGDGLNELFETDTEVEQKFVTGLSPYSQTRFDFSDISVPSDEVYYFGKLAAVSVYSSKDMGIDVLVGVDTEGYRYSRGLYFEGSVIKALPSINEAGSMFRWFFESYPGLPPSPPGYSPDVVANLPWASITHPSFGLLYSNTYGSVDISQAPDMPTGLISYDLTYNGPLPIDESAPVPYNNAFAALNAKPYYEVGDDLTEFSEAVRNYETLGFLFFRDEDPAKRGVAAVEIYCSADSKASFTGLAFGPSSPQYVRASIGWIILLRDELRSILDTGVQVKETLFAASSAAVDFVATLDIDHSIYDSPEDYDALNIDKVTAEQRATLKEHVVAIHLASFEVLLNNFAGPTLLAAAMPGTLIVAPYPTPKALSYVVPS